jgi:hypothetical protein
MKRVLMPEEVPNRHPGVLPSPVEEPARAPEPLRRGLPLGLRLGMAVALTVTVVLGGTALLQQRRETARELADREALLAESLAPLLADIEDNASLDEFRADLISFQRSYVSHGYPDHQVMLRDASGVVVATTLPDPAAPIPESALRASVPVISSLLAGGCGTVDVWQDSSAVRAEIGKHWRMWWLALAITAVTIVATLQVAIYLLISRPLGVLVRHLRRMGMGYLGPVTVPRGAWEVRWLAWRLERTTGELQEIVRRLVAAERRALESLRGGEEGSQQSADRFGAVATLPMRARRDRTHATLLSSYLEDTCRLLETSGPNDPTARAVAEEVWQRTAKEAELIGAAELRARLEDAALRFLEPDEFTRLGRLVAASAAARRGWLGERRADLERALADAQVPVVEIQQRFKHVAGVWRKMEQKQLGLEQVHDLFAFRVIVPEEPHCYTALSAVHGRFEPEPFRFKDYISTPKANGYRSLHTSVRDRDGLVFEVQIRSVAMHQAAEDGAAAHWRYKAEGAAPNHGRLARALRRLGVPLGRA